MGSRIFDRPSSGPAHHRPQTTTSSDSQDVSEDGGVVGAWGGSGGWEEDKVKMVNENGYYIPEGAKGWDRISAMARSSFARAER